MNQKKKQGSVTVEAAILLPIVIIGILTIALLMKIIYFQEAIYHTFINEARKAATEAYLYELETLPKGIMGDLLRIGPQNYWLFNSRLMENISVDDTDTLSTFGITEFDYLYSDFDVDDLIHITLSYKLNFRLPINYINEIQITQSVLMRAWTGSTDTGRPMPYDFMEKPLESNKVYVFPRAGERYHARTCSFVVNEPTMEILSNAVKRQYEACQLCEAGERPVGSIVFCFIDYGRVFHTSECTIVDKYLIEIDINEAEEKGYLRCSKCGGIN